MMATVGKTPILICIGSETSASGSGSVDLSILIGDIVLIPTALFRSHVELRS